MTFDILFTFARKLIFLHFLCNSSQLLDPTELCFWIPLMALPLDDTLIPST